MDSALHFSSHILLYNVYKKNTIAKNTKQDFKLQRFIYNFVPNFNYEKEIDHNRHTMQFIIFHDILYGLH